MKYDDIINHKHHESLRHPRMPRINRAAQFAPFAALTGYENAIEEAGRLTESKIILEEGAKVELDEELRKLIESDMMAEAEITYFIPDDVKEGGHFALFKGKIKNIDEMSGELISKNGMRIKLKSITKIKINNPN